MKRLSLLRNPPRSGLRRRGVLLLVVLSLLVLFVLIGVTFVLLASQSRRMSRADSRAEQYGDDYRRQLDEVFAQVVRDTTNTNSVLRNHSLLNDIYGLDGARGAMSAAPAPIAGGQMYDISATTLTNVAGSTYPTAAQIQTPGYFNGCVLTMLDGPARHLSTRIVGWGYAGTTYTIRVMAFDWPNTSTSTAFVANNPTQSFLINGRPFNGTGFGFNTATGDLTALSAISGIPSALLPNAKFNSAFAALGGADEDYDAADPQNFHLGYMPINPTVPTDIIPSFHRPDLINYIQNNAAYAAGWATPDLQRALMARPLGPTNASGVALAGTPDHPNFTGSNPGTVAFPGIFDAVTGPWDVDNDGDGIADSVWVDIGMPVQTAPDGRRFKPLAAILILDLDGRLNVNAHGNVAQAQATYNQLIPASGGVGPATIADYLFATTPPATVLLPRGSGYGPAEINLGLTPGLTSIFANPATDYLNFFKGIVSGKTYEGRYGEYGKTLPPTYPNFNCPLPGVTALLPAAGADDVLDSIKRFDFPNNYYTSPLSDYGTPGDLWGRAAMGIDYAGQPIYSFLQIASVSGGPVTLGAVGVADPDLPNDPYTLDLSHNRARSAMAAGQTATTNDSAFTASELERILRKFDIDVSALPDRLRYLLDPSLSNTNDLGRMITTDSFDLPSPSILPTKDIAATLAAQNGGSYKPSLHIADLVRAKLTGVFTGNPANPGGNLGVEIQKMLPPELLAGVRFDLNRPFGNGVDDNGNNVVDEPGEYATNKESPATWTSPFGAAVQFDLNNDGAIDPNASNATSDLYARQQYAKYLYILMMLFADQNYPAFQEVGLTAVQQKELTARRIAQWAVNVVDFRDPDSIMTPFEYDVDPFNADGWNVDGMLGNGSVDDNNSATYPDRRLVWGCEYPELLLTETLALHDRRVKDTSNPNKINDMPVADPDMDQVRIPQGSLFLEVYCPHNGNASGLNGYSGDVYNVPQRKLDLGASPDNVYPVWRIAIGQSRLDATVGAAQDVTTRLTQHPDTSTFDPITTGYNGPLPYSLFDPANAQGALQLERLVWFSGINPTGNPDAATYSIYYNKTNTSALLGPGQYAVVGPRALTYVGMNNATTPSTEKFELDTALGKVKYTPANANPPNGIPNSATALPIICVGTPSTGTADVGVSVSEPPLATYYPLPSNPGPTGVVDTYPSTLDTPLDSALTTPIGRDGLQGTKLTPFYKTALLQRLANPLVAYNAVTNPYITVDWQPIDLKVFNGEELPPAPKPDPADPAPLYVPVGSRERGSNNPVDADLWNLVPQQGTTAISVKGPTAVFDYNVVQSLGYLNKAMGTPWTSPPAAQAAYTGAPDPTVGNNTFPWLTWNNRPFTSTTELLQVPATSPEQLVRQFSSIPAATANPFPAVVPGTFDVPCKHLLNFFNSANGAAAQAPYFYRLLEYVQVPSRFVGTETFLKPSNFTGLLPSATGLTEQQLASQFHPPFNKVSNYRDPGRVNINTIPSFAGGAYTNNPIWNAILNGSPGPLWQQIVASRRGDAVLGNNVTNLNSGSPTFFADPFRSAGGAAFYLPGTIAPTSEVNVTMLRPDPTNPALPLFSTPAAAVLPFTNPDRNPYFRYQTLERLSNLLTTRSNVYAVWITVGYFEVTPNGGTGVIDAGHPDGYQLGREVGSDSGEIKRHRAFYIYDRSIPVGFEPGRDHNFDKGVLVKRFIE